MSEPSVRGITKADYQSWLHHPVTKVRNAYLRDFRDALHRELLASFEGGSLVLALEHEARGRCKTLIEVAELPFEAMLEFYTEEENAAEADQSV